MNLSIITINYNDALGLKRTVESVFEQTYTNFEFIVIDGGSSDGSEEYLKQISDKLDYFVSEPDNGIYHAMNKGIAKARGKYLMFLNSGDWFCSKVTLSSIFVQDHDADVVYGNIMIEKNGQFTRKTNGPKNSVITTTYFLYDTIYHQSSFIKRETLSNYGKYDEGYKIISDWVMFLRMAINQCSFEYIEIDVANFDSTGFSSQDPIINHKEKLIELSKPENKNLLQDYLAINRLKLSLIWSKEYEIVKKNRLLYFFIKLYLRGYYKGKRNKN